YYLPRRPHTPPDPPFPTRRSSDLLDEPRALPPHLRRRTVQHLRRGNPLGLEGGQTAGEDRLGDEGHRHAKVEGRGDRGGLRPLSDRKSTRLNSSHEWISYAVFCLK